MKNQQRMWSDLTITIRLNLTWTAFLEWTRGRTVASATRDYSEGEERLPSVHVRMPVSAT